MKKVIATLFLAVFTHCSLALEPAADPTLASVRIKSHGASGTIIKTTVSRSWILSCCHIFFGSTGQLDQALISKRLVIDGPVQPHAIQGIAQSRVVLIDPKVDLSLIEIDNGPFNYVPVAPREYRPGRRVSSAGYDLMRWPATHVHNTILGQLSHWTYTKEKPIEGRSGGGLFDLDAKVLIGVCIGYEVSGEGRGLFVSHQSIMRFLNAETPRSLAPNLPIQKPCPT
jgi:hypothetical protein